MDWTLRDALIWFALSGMCIVALRYADCSAPARAGERWTPPASPTLASVSGALDCLVRSQAPGTYRRRAAEHYTPVKLEIVADAVLTHARRATWPDRHRWHEYVPLVVGILYQQSKVTSDAVSRYNRDPITGERIKVDPRRAWRKPDPRLDYGMFQLHWTTAKRMRPGVRLADLRNPAINVGLGVEWLSRRAGSCADWVRVVRGRCGQRSTSLGCRCRLARRALGGWYWTALRNVRSLIRDVAPLVRRCMPAAAAVPEGA